MKVELKNFKKEKSDDKGISPANARLFIDGILAGAARDRGGGTLVQLYPRDKAGLELIAKVNKALSLGKDEDDAIKDWSKRHEALKNYLKPLFDDYRTRSVQRLLFSEMKENLGKFIVLQRSATTLRAISLEHPVPYYLNNEERKKELVALLSEKALPNLLPGEVLANDNIPKKILIKAGFREDQMGTGISEDVKKNIPKPKNRL